MNELKHSICGLKPGDESQSNANLSKIFADLSSDEISLGVMEKVIKLVAELAKEEKCRAALVENDFFLPLNKILQSQTRVDDLVRTQLCRAIGNLCYYNG